MTVCVLEYDNKCSGLVCTRETITGTYSVTELSKASLYFRIFAACTVLSSTLSQTKTKMNSGLL